MHPSARAILVVAVVALCLGSVLLWSRGRRNTTPDGSPRPPETLASAADADDSAKRATNTQDGSAKDRTSPSSSDIRIFGTVLYALTGEPIANATVSARPLQFREDASIESRETTTDEAGAYSLALPVGWTDFVAACAEGCAVEFHGFPHAVTCDEKVHFRLHAGASVSGRVTLAETGDPVGGVPVRALDEHRDLWEAWWETWWVGLAGVSGPDGAYRIDGVRPGPHLIIPAAHEVGYLFSPEHAVSLNLEKGALHTGVDFVIERGAVVEGIVQAMDETPIAEAKVTVLSENPIEESLARLEGFDPRLAGKPSAMSGDDGRFTLAGLEYGVGYRLYAERKGFAPATTTVFRLESGEIPENVIVTLMPGSTVSGTVFYADGQPASGQWLSLRVGDGALLSSLGEDRQNVESDTDGTFAFTFIGPGAYSLYAHEHDESRSYGAAQPIRVEVDGINPVDGIEVILNSWAKAEGDGLIQGTVLDPAGQPLADVWVRAALSADPRETTRAKTEEDGAFTLSKLPGEFYDLSVTCVQGEGELEGVPVGAKVTLRLVEPTRVSGTVVDADGQPVRACTVNLESEGDLEEAGTLGAVMDRMFGRSIEPRFTDTQGVFEFLHVSPGSYRVTARSGAEGVGESPLFTVVPQGQVTGLWIALKPGARFAGTVENAGGEPVAGASVQLLGTAPGSMSHLAATFMLSSVFRQPAGSALSDPDGLFSIDNVPPGEYTVAASHPDYAKSLSPGTTVLPGTDITDFRIVLTGGGCVSGQFTIDGEPQAGKTIQLIGAGGMHTIVTDDQGRFDLSGLSPGTYLVNSLDADRLRLDGPLALISQAYQVADVADGGYTQVTLGSANGTTVAGTVLCEGLGNVTGVSIRRPGGPNPADIDIAGLTNLDPIIELARFQEGQAFMQPDGSFIIEGVSPGTYIVEVYSADLDLGIANLPEILDIDLTPRYTQEIVVGDAPLVLDLGVQSSTP